jgi:SAM-dependent methyltransferase
MPIAVQAISFIKLKLDSRPRENQSHARRELIGRFARLRNQAGTLRVVMSWFRKKKREQPPRPSGRPAPAHAPASESFDWRSYDSVAAEYERVHAPYTAQTAADLLQLSGAGADARVLDVGTGTARAVEAAQSSVSLAVGVDPAPAMLAVARRQRPGVRIAAADVLDLPFRAETFDAAIANFSLPYFRKLDTALFDVVRVLRRGGRLAVSTWEWGDDELSATWRKLAEDTVGEEILRTSVLDEAPWAEALGNPARLETALRDAGLRPVTVSKRTYRVEMPLEDYVLSHEVEAAGRFVLAMLGEDLWQGFRTRTRQAYADRFGDPIVDFRYALLAVGTKPA